MIEELIENSRVQIDDTLEQLKQIINEINSLNKFIKMYQTDELDEVKLENFSYLNKNDKIELLNLTKTIPKLDTNVFSGQIKKIKEKINKQYKTEIIVEVDEEEKYMLKNLASDYGYSNIEEFMVSILNKEIDRENYDEDDNKL